MSLWKLLRDRTVKIDVPYITRLDQEVRIYQKDFNENTVPVHIAPHTLDMASTVGHPDKT
jgi:serine protein kinase